MIVQDLFRNALVSHLSVTVLGRLSNESKDTLSEEHGFSVCDTCIGFKERLLILLTLSGQEKERKEVLNEFTRHLNFVRRERAEYTRIRTAAAEQPNRILSIIIDGADQAKLALPKLGTSLSVSNETPRVRYGDMQKEHWRSIR